MEFCKSSSSKPKYLKIVVFMGNENSGKTRLIHCLHNPEDKFTFDYKPTVESNFYLKTIQIKRENY